MTQLSSPAISTMGTTMAQSRDAMLVKTLTLPESELHSMRFTSNMPASKRSTRRPFFHAPIPLAMLA
jgi:hypothetical protein